MDENAEKRIAAFERKALSDVDKLVQAVRESGIEGFTDNSEEMRKEIRRLVAIMREKIKAGNEIEPLDKEWTVTFEGSAAHFKDGRSSGKTKQTPAEAIATVANMLGQVLADLPEDTVAAARVRLAIRLLSELRVSG